MKNVIYCKFNQSRNREYQTITRIVEEDGKRYVEKKPLTSEARPHIESFPQKYKMTSSIYKNMSFLPCNMEDGTVLYDYIEGITLSDYTDQYMEDWDAYLTKIKEAIDELYVVNSDRHQPFCMTEEFVSLFGNIDCSDDVCIRPANLDVIFDNIFIDDNRKAMVFDYEWVYDIAIPEKYTIYRVLSRLYDKYFDYFSAHIDFEDFAKMFGIDETQFERYIKMESSFIGKIYGRGDGARSENLQQIAQKSRQNMSALKDLMKEHEQLRSDYIALKCEKELQEEELRQKEQEVLFAHHELSKILESKSWKIMSPMRFCGQVLRALKHQGRIGVYRFVRDKFKNKTWPKEIPSYLNHKTAPVVLNRQRKHRFDREYKISVLTPFFNTREDFLRQLLDSLSDQTYYNWELCAVDFSSQGNNTVQEIIGEYAKKDHRIIYVRDFNNRGISENTNKCLELATGDYIAVLDHDDLLHPAAFYEVMKVINEEGSDFIYSDEMRFEGTIDNVFTPYYKPDFGEDQLRTQNFVCHLNVYKRSLLNQVGLYRKECDGSQDHDMVLRLTEVAQQITHIPKFLYYWRVHNQSVAMNIAAKPYATYAGIHAIEMQLERLGMDGRMESVRNNIPCYRRIPTVREQEPIGVVIWGAENTESIYHTLQNIQDLLESEYSLSVVLGENQTGEWIEQMNDDHMVGLYVQTNDEFTPMMINNILRNHREKFVLFIKAGVTVTAEYFPEEFLMYAKERGVAAVDAKLEYLGGRTFSAGVTASQQFQPYVQFRCHRKPAGYEGYETAMIHVRNVSGVSGLCTMIAKEDWLELPLPHTTNCNSFIATSLQAHKNGKRLVWNPYVVGTADFRAYDSKFNTMRYSTEDVPVEDPFYNSKIAAFHLE